MSLPVGLFMLVMSAGIAGIWTVDILRSPEVDRTLGILRARDRSNGSLLIPHWIAEYATALVLLGGGIGLVIGAGPGAWSWLVPIGLGSLAYTSLNSLGWVLADRSRAVYGIPMAIGLIGSIVSIGLLVAGALLDLPAA